MAGTCAGVDAADVAGVNVPALVMLAVMGGALASNEAGGTYGIDGVVATAGSEWGLSISFSERKSFSFKFRMWTRVATSSWTVGMPSTTVTRTRNESFWNSSSRKGA